MEAGKEGGREGGGGDEGKEAEREIKLLWSGSKTNKVCN